MAEPDGPGWTIVSGAAGALGAAAAQHYLGLGHRVLALDVDAARLAEMPAAAALARAAVDACDPLAVGAAIDGAIGRGGRIGLLVNAVGLIWNEPVLTLKGPRLRGHAVGSFEKVLAANLTGAFSVAVEVAARMVRAGGGVIVNFSSVASSGIIGQAAYAAAKAGIEGMTRAMALELGPLGVRVNAVAPGFIDVASTRAAVGEAGLRAYADRTPVRRLGTVTDVLAAIDALAANGFLNGVVLPVDGGLRP